MKQFAGKKMDYEFKVGGISLLLLQKDQTDKLMQVLGMTGRAPILAQMTNIPELWEKLLSLFNLGDVYKEPQPQTQPQGQPQGQPQLQGQGQRISQQEILQRESRKDIQGRAASDAKKTVAKMSPQEIMAA